MMNLIKILIFNLIFLLSCPIAGHAEMVVIVNPSNAITNLNALNIRDIYLFKKVTWNDGTKIVPINLPVRDPLHKEFSDRLLGRSLPEMENYYVLHALSGLGQPPIILTTPDAVKDMVSRIEGAIGYIDSQGVDNSVKVIKIHNGRLKR